MLPLLLAAVLGAGTTPFPGGGGSGGGGGSAGNGITSVSSLGACASPNAGQVVYLTTATALRLCDGTTWQPVFSKADGVLPTPSTAVPGAWFTATTTQGSAFRVTTAGVKIEVGPSPNAYLREQGGIIYSPYLSTQQAQADTYASLGFAAPTLLLNPLGWAFNGTTPLKGRVAAAVTFDSASINNGTCLVQSVTVAGAVLGDFVHVNADFDLPDTVLVGNARVTSANTVALRLCNVDLALPKDPASGPYNFVLER